MKTRSISEKQIECFISYLKENEKSRATVSKYVHDVQVFTEFSNGHEVNKSLVMAYKEHLAAQYTVGGANSMLAALNSFFRFLDWQDCCVKQFKVQRRAFCSESEELTREEYLRLVSAAEGKGNGRLSLIIQTICGTGIRVSELVFVTVESVRRGEAVVNCKGKLRSVFFVAALRKKLLAYVRSRGIKSGAIFITKSGRPISRCSVWKEMKALCEMARVSPTKVFPHNLRHLFARTFYGVEKDIAKLADILGHSSIDTTRIYVMTTCSEHRRRMENMRLII